MSSARNESYPYIDPSEPEHEAEVIELFPVAEYDPMKDPATIARFLMAGMSMNGQEFARRIKSMRQA